MEVDKQVLILDNFRSVLSEYSVDIQDVVRSAILDGVDVSKYISVCKDNPYRLDQIRIGMKEGLSNIYFKISSGDIIYRIRRLKNKGTNLSALEEHLQRGTLSNEYIEYLLRWLEDGVNTFGIDISIVPNELLATFDYGLRSGFDMRVFNNGTSYSKEYIRCCLQIIKNNKPINSLLNGRFSIECMNLLCSFSKLSLPKWNVLLDNIDDGISTDRLKAVIQLVKNNISIRDLQKKDSNGNYVYEDKCLALVYSAYTKKIDYRELIANAVTFKEMKDVLDELIYSKKSVSGRLRKTSV